MMPRTSHRAIALTELGMRATDLIRAGALPPAPRQSSARARLTVAEVKAIRELAAQGVERRLLASRFDVKVGTIGQIVRGERWRGVGDE